MRPVLTLAFAAGFAVLPRAAPAEQATYSVDPAHAVVAFLVMHAGYAKVLGQFSDVEGTFSFDDETGEVSDITARISAQSVSTGQADRDEHVRSEDFLDAEAHPDITFTSTEATAISATEGVVEGDLTIRGVTNPVELRVTLNQIAQYPCCHEKKTVGISAKTSFLRSAFGSTYALPVFVGDEVEVILEFEAIRQD
jgi:polyisoprenoid-binding protein YceI